MNWTDHALEMAEDREIDREDAEWVVDNGYYHGPSNANPNNQCHIGWIGDDRLVVITNAACTTVVTAYWA